MVTKTITQVSKLHYRRRRRNLRLPENQRYWKQNQPRYRLVEDGGYSAWKDIPCVVPVPSDPESWLQGQADLNYFGLEEKLSLPFP